MPEAMAERRSLVLAGINWAIRERSRRTKPN